MAAAFLKDYYAARKEVMRTPCELSPSVSEERRMRRLLGVVVVLSGELLAARRTQRLHGRYCGGAAPAGVLR